MVVCSKCQNEVPEGKFCRKCGAPLVVVEKVDYVFCSGCGAKVKGKFCTNCGMPVNVQANNETSVKETKDVKEVNNIKGGKEGNAKNFFKNLGSGISEKLGNIATALTAIKSNYKDDALIYYVDKIPKVKEKEIVVNTDEAVLIDFGKGFSKQEMTFTTQNDNFTCIFYKKNTDISNITFKIPFSTNVNKLKDEDVLAINIEVSVSTKVLDFENLAKKLIESKKMSWTLNDICESFKNYVTTETSDKLTEIYKTENGIILNDSLNQIKKYEKELSDLIKQKLSDYYIFSNSMEVKNVDFDKSEANKLLIKNLY